MLPLFRLSLSLLLDHLPYLIIVSSYVVLIVVVFGPSPEIVILRDETTQSTREDRQQMLKDNNESVVNRGRAGQWKLKGRDGDDVFMRCVEEKLSLRHQQHSE